MGEKWKIRSPEGKVREISSEEWLKEGDELLAAGWVEASGDEVEPEPEPKVFPPLPAGLSRPLGLRERRR